MGVLEWVKVGVIVVNLVVTAWILYLARRVGRMSREMKNGWAGR